MTKGSYLDSLSPTLAKRQGAILVPGKSAGAAVIFAAPRVVDEVLLIRRAEREGDPWSGQVAFPGGMVSSSDRSFEETARRETAEEVGVDLGQGRAEFLGYMGEFQARTRQVSVVPSVYRVAATPKVTLSSEAASFQWVPLGSLAREESRSTYLLERGEARLAFPSFVYGGLVIWGLTERIISTILGGGADPGDGGPARFRGRP